MVTSFKIPEDERERLEDLAWKARTSRSKLIGVAVARIAKAPLSELRAEVAALPDGHRAIHRRVDR